MKRAQKKIERDPRQNFFLRAKPSAVQKQEITNKVRDLIKTKPHKKKVREICWKALKKSLRAIRQKKMFMRVKPYAERKHKIANESSRFNNYVRSLVCIVAMVLVICCLIVITHYILVIYWCFTIVFTVNICYFILHYMAQYVFQKPFVRAQLKGETTILLSYATHGINTLR